MKMATPFQMIEPFNVYSSDPATAGASFVAATNVAQTVAAYAGGEALGDVVYFGDNDFALIDDTAPPAPPLDPLNEPGTHWGWLGPSNAMRPFDLQVGLDRERVISTAATADDQITYGIIAGQRVTGIAFFGVVAETISIVVDGDLPGEILDVTYQLRDMENYNGSFYGWFYSPARPEIKYANFDVNIPAGSAIEITIDRPGGLVEVAAIVIGEARAYGGVQPGSRRSLQSRSIKAANALTNSLKRRLPSARTTFNIAAPGRIAEGAFLTLEQLDGVAAVYGAGDDNPALLTYGFHTSVAGTLSAAGHMQLTVEVESL